MTGGYRVELLPVAQRQLEKCAPPIKQRLKTAIDRLASNPDPPGVERLKGQDRLLRIRVGDYRILYRVIDDRLVVLVIRVGHRREVYRGMARRLLGR
jgi:mRNA interferase RelE/StbE